MLNQSIIEDKRLAFQNLDKKVKKSIEIILETERMFGKDNTCIAWSGGKDSTILLHHAQTAYKGNIPFKVIIIDISENFKEIYSFRDRISIEWNLDLIILGYPEAKQIINIAKGAVESLYLPKIKVMEDAMRKLGIKALMTGIRWDEQSDFANEKYFSEKKGYVRVNPILHFMERDIWEYINKKNVPYCELYERRNKSLGWTPYTKFDSGGLNSDETVQDMEAIVERLRNLGYF